jgi:4-amino-4-deoxy-L-arabinose transferase-like glycosyltransferase
MIKSFYKKVLLFISDWKWVIILGIIISFFFSLLRLINLTILPIFADEAIYIRWAQVMRAEPSLRFIPLSVGSPPFFMWMMMPFLKVVADPLFAGRLLSVFCGFGSLIGVFILSFLLYKNKRLSLISIVIYSVVPYFVFSERVALIDSMLSLEAIWLTILALMFVNRQRLDITIIAGLLFGISLMTKSFAVLFLIPLFSVLLLFKLNKEDKETNVVNLVKIISGLILIAIIGYGIYNFILRLGPNFSLISTRNDIGIFTLKDLTNQPLGLLIPHLIDLSDWIPNLLTPFIFIAMIFGIFLGLRKFRVATIFLMICSFCPIIVESIISRVFTPRYILFAVWPFVIFSSLAIEFVLSKVENKKPVLISKIIFPAIFLMIFLAPAIYYDYLLLTNPEKSPLPRNLRSGHLEEWTAGQGIKETVSYLKNRLPGKKILVGTEGTFGTLPDGLQIFFQNVPNITIIGLALNHTQVPQPLINSLVDHDEVYFVINDDRLRFDPDKFNVTIVNKYPKAIRPDGTFQSLLLMKINSEK